MKKTLCFFGVSLFLLTSCGSKDAQVLQKKWQVPSNMYALAEDQSQSPAVTPELKEDDSEDVKNGERLNENFQTLLDNSKESLDQTQEFQAAPQSTQNHPPQWAPWHVAYLLTDFSISAKGVLGHLLGTGTPTVTAIWAKAHSQLKPASAAEDQMAIQIFGDQSPEELDKQVTPVVNAIAAARKISDKELLKKNVIQSAQYFTALMGELESAPKSSWWVSRLRLDFTVDVTGNITPAVATGGEVKIRLEWHRIMRNTPSQAPQILPASYSDLQKNMRDFVIGMSEDLEQMSEGQERKEDGFKAYQFIVGIGITKSATIGIAKASGSTIGEVYFGRDIPKPNNPYAPKTVTGSSDFVNIVEKSPSPEHLAFAKANDIPSETVAVSSGDDSSRQSILYKANRKVFQKGLKHAFQMAKHFTNHADRPDSGKWKIYEFRVNFSISLTGASKLATVAGNGVTEIDFYNEKF